MSYSGWHPKLLGAAREVERTLSLLHNTGGGWGVGGGAELLRENAEASLEASLTELARGYPKGGGGLLQESAETSHLGTSLADARCFWKFSPELARGERGHRAGQWVEWTLSWPAGRVDTELASGERGHSSNLCLKQTEYCEQAFCKPPGT